MYIELATKYGWTFEQIAEMNPYQQKIAYQGPTTITLNTLEDYQEYVRRRQQNV